MFGSLCPACRAVRQTLSSNLWRRHISTISVAGEDVEIIRYPIGKQQKFLRAKEKRKKKGKHIVVPRPGRLLISTNDRKLNLYTNEFPTKFEPPTLASQTWTSRKSPGRYFIIHPTRENPSVVTEEHGVPNFRELQLSSHLVDALMNGGFVKPTNIQKKVIPAILEGDNVMLAAETGSGKTYGYILPIVESVLQMKENCCDHDIDGPLAIILAPTKELVGQILTMSKDLNLPINFAALDEIWKMKKRKKLKSAEIVIATPVLALAALRARILSLNAVKYAVIDECDTLLDESFAKYVCNILGRLNIKSGISKPLLGEMETQLILCSATFPNYAEKALEDVISISDLSTISTGYMHRISPHVTHKFLRVRPSEKFSTLIHLLQQSEHEPGKLTMVFCNKKDTVHWLTKELILHGIHADKTLGGVSHQERRSVIHHAAEGSLGILICTDVSSRGIDTQKTAHVINYDFPDAASDYIHRSGRVGRVGQNTGGKVTSLICKKWEVPLVMKIEEAARRRERIEGVNANIKSHHYQRWEEKTQPTNIELEFEDESEL